MSSEETVAALASRGAQRGSRRRPRLRGVARECIRSALAEQYKNGASIRDLIDEHHLSYGLARTLLLEAGVELRARGAVGTEPRAARP